MHASIESRLPEVRELCQACGVSSLELFGSAARVDFDPERSDVDLLVEWDPRDEGSLPARWWRLEQGLRELFGRPVDLLTMRSIRNGRLRAAIESQPRVVIVA